MQEDLGILSKGTSWFTQGCFFNKIDRLLEGNKRLSIPTNRFVGKSPEYINQYMVLYNQQQAKQRDAATVALIVIGIGACVGCMFLIKDESDSFFDDISSLGDGCNDCNYFGYGFNSDSR